MLLFIVATITSLFVVTVSAGRVGECRTECIERNRYKIVRVHLASTDVSVGICRNSSLRDSAILSHIFPFKCDRNIGAWTFDDDDEEGIVPFMVRCPYVDIVDRALIDSCVVQGGAAPAAEPPHLILQQP